MTYPTITTVTELVLKGATDNEIALSFTQNIDCLNYKRALNLSRKVRKVTEFFKNNPDAIEKGKPYCVYQIVRICRVNTTAAGNLFKNLKESNFFCQCQ